MAHWKFLICLVLFAMSTGCGQGEFVSVTGKVTLRGEPLTTGAVSYHPRGGGSMGYGNLQTDGSYIAKSGTQTGLRPGEYAVTVVATEPVVDSQDMRELIPKSITPLRYAKVETSDLQFVVPAAGGTFDIALQQ